MIISNLNISLQHLIHHLSFSIRTLQSQELVKVTPSGTYHRADVLNRLFLAESRNYVFEFYTTYKSMKNCIKLNNKLVFFNKIMLEQNHNIAYISKKSHFYGFTYLDGIGLKAAIDVENKSYLYIPLQKFCDHIVSCKSSMGMKNIEIVHYFNFLNMHYDESTQKKCFILNLYKDTKINVFTFNEVENAIAGYNTCKSVEPIEDFTANSQYE